MDGLTKDQLDKAESNDASLGAGPRRPRDAATLILLDRRGGEVHVLMGRRHSSHAFMPGKFVFPGGRTDPDDGRVPVTDMLDPLEEAKLLATIARRSQARARAIALSAIRETYEEAGLLIGRKGPFSTAKADWQGFVEHGVQPTLQPLRLVARAITPPGRVRRFDTRFLATWRTDVAVELPGGGPTNELEGLIWLPLREAPQADVPVITKTILEELQQRLAADPQLRPGGPVPFYRMVRNSFIRDLF
ncbi:NUDIX hydrolase [Mesorhizobium sp. KR2-14]|uniref:NUDIX hydrolase n=1 Tax=Mesorhizobium sp. KR2-14 TaxID=3156610 RepID=UPI0032B43373